MTLDEYISHIEAQQKASIAEAIAVMTKASATLSELFSIEENN